MRSRNLKPFKMPSVASITIAPTIALITVFLMMITSVSLVPQRRAEVSNPNALPSSRFRGGAHRLVSSLSTCAEGGALEAHSFTHRPLSRRRLPPGRFTFHLRGTQAPGGCPRAVAWGRKAQRRGGNGTCVPCGEWSTRNSQLLSCSFLSREDRRACPVHSPWYCVAPVGFEPTLSSP